MHKEFASNSDRILRLPTVVERTGLSRATIYRKILKGTFPRQLAISQRCSGWRESEINEWMHNPIYYKAPDTCGKH